MNREPAMPSQEELDSLKKTQAMDQEERSALLVLVQSQLKTLPVDQLINHAQVVANLYWSAAVEKSTARNEFSLSEVDIFAKALCNVLGTYPASEVAYSAARYVLSARRSSLGGRIEAPQSILKLLPWFKA